MLKFFNENKVLLGLFSIVLVFFIIVTTIVVSFMKNNEKIEEVPVAETSHGHDEHGETLHGDYTPDIEEPFDKSKDSATVSDFVLGEPTIYKHSTKEGTGAVMNAGANKSALITSYGGALYLYDLKSESVFVVEKFTSHGNIDLENNFVFYSKYTDEILKDKEKQNLHILETKTNERTKVGELEKGVNINSSVFYNGVVFYSASDLSGTKNISGVVKSNLNTPTATINKYQSSLSKYEFTKFKSYKDLIFGYDKKSNSILKFENEIWTKVVDVPTNYLIDFAVSENNVFLSYTDLKNSYNTINGKVINELKNNTNPTWADDNNLLILIGSNLHIYNLEENKLEPVLNAVNKVFTDHKFIYLQDDGESSTNIKTIEILNR